MSKEKIRAVIDRVLWTAGATESNRELLADAIFESIAAPSVASPQHDSDCSTNNRGVPELLGPCDCSIASAEPTDHDAIIRDAIRVAYMQGYDNGKDDQQTGGGCSRYVPGNVEAKLSASVRAALASVQKTVLTDEQCAKIKAQAAKATDDWLESQPEENPQLKSDGVFIRHIAQAIEAACGPNLALVEALQQISSNLRDHPCYMPNASEQDIENEGGDAGFITDQANIADAALAAVGAIPPAKEW